MKRFTPVLLAGCLVFSVSSQLAWSADGNTDGKPPIYGAALGSYLLPDSVRADTYGYGGQLILGLPLSKQLSIEINGFGTSLQTAHQRIVSGHTIIDNSASDAQFGAGADLNYRFGQGKYVPFVLGGVGAEWETYQYTTGRYKWGPFVDVGVGLLARLSPHISLRGEVRYYGIYNDSTYTPHALGDMRVNLGIQYAFFKDPAPPPPPPLTCNCVLPPPPPAKPACPPAPAGVKVDANGCIIKQDIVLRGINFAFNKDELTPAARDTLSPIADSLAAQPKLYVKIEGHTDSIGSAAYNLELSRDRAESVKRYLVSRGVNADHLSTQGLGKADPIASNKTAVGRAENRRVEFKVLDKPPSVTIIKKPSTSASKAAAETGEPASLKSREPR